MAAGSAFAAVGALTFQKGSELTQDAILKLQSEISSLEFSFSKGVSDRERAVEETNQKIDELLKDVKNSHKSKGNTQIGEKSGNFEDTIKDFDNMELLDVNDNLPTNYGRGKFGRLPDGRKVIARPGSTTDGRPTLEIQKPNGKELEIRYGD